MNIQMANRPVAVRLCKVSCLLLGALVVHVVLFGIFDLLPSSELKLGGWMVADAQALNQYRSSLNLPQSAELHVRYTHSLTRLLHGDLGRTLSGYSVLSVLRDRLVVSLPTIACSLVIMILTPTLLTVWRLARRQPSAWAATHFFLLLGFLPPLITSALLKTTALVFGWNEIFRESAVHLVCLSALAAFLPTAMLASVACSEAATIMQRPFVTTLLSQGHSDFFIRFRLLTNIWHAVRPIAARAMIQLLSGLVFVEIVWDVPGFGRLLNESLQSGDYALLQGWMMIIGILVVGLTRIEARQI